MDGEIPFIGLLITDVRNMVSIWVAENSPNKNFSQIAEIQLETVVYSCCHIQKTSNDPGCFLLATSEIIHSFDLKEKKLCAEFQASRDSKVDFLLFDKDRMLVFSSSNKEVKVWSANNFLSRNPNIIVKKSF